MELNHETRARIFGLYIGCEVQYGYEGRTRTGKLEGLNEKGEAIIFDPGIKVFSHYRYVRLDLAQLLLSPLEAITEADAVACYELIFAPDAVARGEKINTVRSWIMRNVIPYQVADHLRELGYAVDYKGIDLFEAGIAIDRTKKETV